MTTNKPKPNTAKPKYQPTEREWNTFDEILSRNQAEATPRVKVTLTGENTATVSLDHPEEALGCALLMKAIGTTDYNFIESLVKQLANSVSKGKQIDETQLNFMISIIKGIQPRDQLEAMHAAQMAAVHIAIMNFVQKLTNVGNNITLQESIERSLNKLVRTFTTQLEALKRYRMGGEQKVTVQHVSVGEGGQAIVGNVTQGARQAAPEKPNPTPALTDAQQPAMPELSKRAPERVALQSKRRDEKRSST